MLLLSSEVSVNQFVTIVQSTIEEDVVVGIYARVFTPRLFFASPRSSAMNNKITWTSSDL
jgi:hypothetical protein